jgi:rhamnosyltransferase
LRTTQALSEQDERAILNTSEKGFSVASVTVSYNGARVIGRQLEALKRQSYKINEIIVVNNASTDGLPELLAATFPEITVLNLPDNRGVGGALCAGLDYAALTKKYDWVWLFDDDSIPADNALEMLLAGLDYVNGNPGDLAILAPVCEDEKTKMQCPGMLWQNGRIVRVHISPDEPLAMVDLVISSGSLVRKEAVEAVGLPRADFFMDFVDFEHCLRLRHHGFRIAVVRASHLDHVLGEPATFKILGRVKRWTDQAPWRCYYIVRNEVFTIWRYYPALRNKAFFLGRSAWLILCLLLFGKRKMHCLQMMCRGFLDGRSGRLGIRFHAANS